MKPNKALRNFLTAIGSSMLAISSASANDLYWDSNGDTLGFGNTNGTWGTSAWWNLDSTGTPAPTITDTTAADDVFFGTLLNSYSGTVTTNASLFANSITFGGAQQVILSGTGNITLGNGTAGEGGITRTGNGATQVNTNITLANSQTWTNNATGSLIFDNAGNRTLNIGSHGLTLSGSGNFSINGNNETFGSLSGSGTLTVNNTGQVILRGNNSSFTGDILINNGGSLVWGNNVSLGTNNNITITSGILEGRWQNLFSRSLGDGANQVQITGGASGFGNNNGGSAIRLNNDANFEVVWGAANEAGNANATGFFNPSTLLLQSEFAQDPSRNLTFENRIDLNASDRTISVSGGTTGRSSAVISGIIRTSSGTAGLTKEGNGRLILTGNNTYNGATIINDGIVQFGTAFGNTWSGFSLPNDSNLTLNGGVAAGWFSFDRALGDQAGEVQITGGRSGFTIMQGDRVDLTLGANELVWGSDFFKPTTLVLNDSAAGAATVIRLNNALDLNGGNRTVFSDGVGAFGNNAASIGALGRVLERGALLAGDIQNTDTGNTAGMVLTGSALIGFSGTNTYDGGTQVQEGGAFFNSLASMPATGAVTLADGTSLVVSVGGAGQWTTGTSGNGTIGGLLAGLGGQAGSTVDYGNGNVTLGLNVGSGTQTYAGDIANITGTSSTAIGIYSDGGAGIMTLSGNNSYTGGTTINTGGTLGVGSANAIGTGALTFLGGTLQSSDSTARTIANSIVLGGNVGIGGTGDIAFTNTGTVTLGANRTFTVGSGITASFDQIFTGGNAITKTGLGDMVLTGANSFTGNVTVQQGNLIAGGDVPSVNNVNGAFGRANSTINVGVANNNNDAGVLAGGAYTIGRNFQVLSQNNTDTGTRTITFGGNSAHASTFSGNIILGTTNQATKGINLTAAAGGSVTFSGVISNPTGQDAAEQTAAAAGTAVTVNAAGGRVILTNANTYTGATLVSAGTLLVNNTNGSGTGSGTVTVASGATLGGSGTVAGNTTIAGIHSPGNSPGIQTFEANLTYEANAEVIWELVNNTALLANRGTDYDGINVGGALEFEGATTLTLVFSGAFNDDVSSVNWSDSFWDNSYVGTEGWLIYSGATALIGFENLSINTQNWLDGNDVAFNTARGGDYFFSLYQDGNNIYLNYNVIPEPKTALLGAIGFLMLFRRRR
ncbi:MAG: beta strand repeat-containing protein [Luteolibacter sp.]